MESTLFAMHQTTISPPPQHTHAQYQIPIHIRTAKLIPAAFNTSN